MKELKLIDYWADQLQETAQNSTTLTIETERIDRGMTYDVSSCNICNKSKANQLLEIGIKSGSSYHPIRKLKVGSDTYSFKTEVKDIVLTEGQQLYGKVYNPDATNVCVLTFNGKLYKKE